MLWLKCHSKRNVPVPVTFEKACVEPIQTSMMHFFFFAQLVNGLSMMEPFLLDDRSRLSEVSCKKGVLRNFAKFTGKQLCQGLFFNKVAQA